MSDRSSDSVALFVYGTLLQESNSEMAEYLKRNATDLGKGYLFGKLYDLGEYPGATLCEEKESKVFGHVYLLHHAASALQVLDAYEEFGPDFEQPNLFTREVVAIHFQDTTVRSCWAYLYNRSVHEAPRITSGDYLKHLRDA